MEEEKELAVRQAARAVLLDERDRILLVRFDDPNQKISWWATVGGWLKTGENYEEALRRALEEATGLEEFEIGPWVWQRENSFVWQGKWMEQEERFYLVRVAAFIPTPLGTQAEKREDVGEMKWWTLSELRAGKEKTAPSDLEKRLRKLLEKGEGDKGLGRKK